MSDIEALRVTLADAIGKGTFARHRDLILRHAEGYVLLDAPVDVPDEFAIGASRLGGLPDLPPGIDWPEYDGKKIPFLAQVDLSSLPQWPGRPLPADGWLFVFHLVSNDVYPDPVVVHHRGPRDTLVRAAEPDRDAMWPDWERTRMYQPLPLASRLGLTVDCPRVARELGADDGVFDANLWVAVTQAGAAEPMSPGGRDAGYLLGDTSPEVGFANTYADWGEKDGDDWMNLIALRSVGSMMWSDGGTLHLIIRRTDLAAGTFGNLTYGTGPPD